MDSTLQLGQQLASRINQEIAEAGYRQEVFAIGPSGIPIPAKALLPAGFNLIINLIPNDQSKNLSTISDK